MSQKASPLSFRPSQVHNPRNAFDLSHHSYFTAPAGLLQPCYTCDCIPGDFVKLDVSNFTRTVPVNTAAFARLTEHVDFYFVPYRLVWRWFDDMITGVQNTDTSYNPNSTSIPLSMPFINGAQISFMLSSTKNDIFGYPVSYMFYRMMDQLGFPCQDTLTHTQQMYASGSVYYNKQYNPFRFFAFMRLYHDFYRNSDYEVNNPRYYNLDWCGSGASLANSDCDVFLDGVCHLYHLWAKDKFTSFKPSPLYDSSVHSPISYADNGSFGNIVHDGTNVSYKATFVNPAGGFTDQFSVNSLRNMFAMDRLGRISMLAPKTYQDQLAAHFGVKPFNHNSCSYLGSFDSHIQIGDVVATATSNNTEEGMGSVLGQLAGRGISQGHLNQPINFEAKEHGVIIGVHYVQPESEYNSQCLDEFNIKYNRSDFFLPEFDNLGLQPLTIGQIGQSLAVKVDPNVVVGYQSRYMEYKTDVDKCHGQFQSGGPLSIWSISRGNEGCITTTDASTWLHINPAVVASIFPSRFNGDPLTDSFLCHYRFDVTKVSNMSVNGIPTL